MDEEMVDTKRFFESLYVPLCDAWLESCIKWFREQQPSSTYSRRELQAKVYEQWLVLDLREVEVPQLTPNDFHEKKTIINRNLSLQLMSVADISKPKLSQLHKIRNANVLCHDKDPEEDNYGNNNNGKRVLQLTLTDGICEVKAMEYKTVPVLNINLAPGIKIRINAPVIVGRGQMMLEQHNIKVLGGEVEEILISNSAENVLARALNLPENPNRNVIDESSGHTNTGVNITLSNIMNQSHVQIDNRNITYNAVTTNISNNQVRPSASNYINKTSSVNQSSVQVHSSNNFNLSEEQEELRLAAEIDLLLETERELMASTSSPQSPILDRFKVDGTDNINITSKLQKKVTTNTPSGSVKYSESILEEEEEDIFGNMDIDEHLDKIEQQMSEQTEIVILISELTQKKRNNITGKFKVHAKFKAIIQKLTVVEVWSIQISIIDNSGELIVSVHSDVISNLIGYPPSAILDLRKSIEAEDTETTTKVMKALDGLKKKLVNLDCVMEIEINQNQQIPTITALL